MNKRIKKKRWKRRAEYFREALREWERTTGRPYGLLYQVYVAKERYEMLFPKRNNELSE